MALSRKTWCCILTLGLSGAALSAEGEFAAYLGAGMSDNIGRTVTDRQDETITSLGTQFSYSQDSRRLHTNLTGDLAWLDYVEGTYDSEVFGNVGARLRVDVIENRLSWAFVDRFGQAQTDLLAAPDPSNREYVNQISTGPDIALRLGSVTQLQIAGRYMRVDFEDSPLDSQRYMGSLSLGRQMSNQGSVALRGAMQRIDPAEAPIYDLGEVVAVYEIDGARSSIGLEAGATRVKPFGGSGKTGAVLRAEVSRRLGTRAFVTLRAAREYTDSGGSLGGWDEDGLPQNVSDTLNLSRTTDPYVADSVRVTWRAEGRLTRVELGGIWLIEKAKGPSELNRRERGLMVRATRNLGNRVNAGIDLRYVDHDVGLFGGNKQEYAALNLAWQIGPRFDLAAIGELTRFDGDLESGVARENRIWLRLGYSTGAR